MRYDVKDRLEGQCARTGAKTQTHGYHRHSYGPWPYNKLGAMLLYTGPGPFLLRRRIRVIPAGSGVSWDDVREFAVQPDPTHWEVMR